MTRTITKTAYISRRAHKNLDALLSQLRYLYNRPLSNTYVSPANTSLELYFLYFSLNAWKTCISVTIAHILLLCFKIFLIRKLINGEGHRA